jgi:tetratricopeptide (TPR) repeat protein
MRSFARRVGLAGRGVFPLRGVLGLLLALLTLASDGLAQVSHLQAAARLLDQGQTEQAETEARQALHTPATRALALEMLGTIRLQQGKYTESVTFLNQALALNPRLPGAHTTLGSAYVLQGKSAPARKSFQEALRLDPGNVNARFDWAKLESSLRNWQPSLNLLTPIAAQVAASDEGVLLLASDYAGLGKKEKLRALVHNWRQLPAPSDDASFDFSALLAANGLMDEARDVLDAEAARVNVQSSAALAARLGEAYANLRVLDRAEQAFQRALSLNPECAACYQSLASIAERQANSEKALAYLVTARKLSPDDPEIQFEFGKVCLERNLLDDAVPALEKAAKLQPERDQYVYVLASAHVARGNLTKAESLLMELKAKHPKDAVLDYAMGTVYYLMGKYSDAESLLTQSLQMQPDQVAASYYLALAYDSSGDEDRAVALFRELLKNHPKHAPSYVKLGAILVRQHQYDEARQDLERAIELDPVSVEAHHQLGLALLRLGRKADSDAQFAESRRLETQQRSQSEMRLRLLLPE